MLTMAGKAATYHLSPKTYIVVHYSRLKAACVQLPSPRRPQLLSGHHPHSASQSYIKRANTHPAMFPFVCNNFKQVMSSNEG
mmetsp:Transcript_27340/g.77193  ORF Transcript_27340/g.77193 Transcript_27340/m.77193 type:complete len:82 (-) Transcript_27340:227-472(-)